MKKLKDVELDILVLKRNNKKVNFEGEKIALAIKKAFDRIENESYNEEDINKVFFSVIEVIQKEYKDKDIIKLEEIQDINERQLKELGYDDIYEEFSNYRLRRNESRKVFSSEQKLHKFMKTIEDLSFSDASSVDIKRENANVDGNTAMGTMLQYGSTVSKEFTKAYLLKPEQAHAHDEGAIHIHDMDFQPMRTTTCMQINLEKLFEKGFSTGHGHLRTPNSIASYGALAAIAIQSNQNDQHGGQSIPAFDIYMKPGVVKTFRKHLKQELYDYLKLTGFLSFIDFDKMKKEIDRIESLEFDKEILYSYAKGADAVIEIIESVCEKALNMTDRGTYQTMEAFVHNLNTMHSRAGAQVPFSSLNLGTDTTPEGRMVTKNYLLATDSGLGFHETPIFPISIFKVKEGINYNPEDPNYDLFELACKVSAKRLFPNFAFIDAPHNIQYYDPTDYRTEITYMGCRTRVIANVADPSRQIVAGRGNLSFTSINLVRLGIKHGILKNPKANMDEFYKELIELMDLVKQQLLDRFELQCSARVSNFPFLLGQGIWMDSEKLKPNDKLKKVLKHGTLTIGFIGLAETLKALTGKHHGESSKAQELGLEIVEFMRKRCDVYAEEYKLNFSLIATPAEGLSGRFTNIDKSIFGIIPEVTDREYYTNSFHVPVYYDITAKNKIKLEAPYHALTNAGHISYVELDGDTVNNVDAFIKVVRMMKEAGIGYGAINHPVDRDPVCGFSGVINDICPGCNRREGDVPFERIRRITGYLVGTVDRFNNGKRSEERDRVKHGVDSKKDRK